MSVEGAATISVRDLPDEVLRALMHRVPLPERTTLPAVCRRWRELMADDGLFTVQLLVPRLLLRAWLGSADDDIRGSGLQLDLSRPVKLSLAGASAKTRVIGRFGVSGGAATSSTAEATAAEGAPASVEVWARVVPHNVARLRELVEGYTRGDAAVLTLAARLPPDAGAFTSFDIAMSRAGDGRMVRTLDKLVVGIGVGHLCALDHLRATGCRHLAWATLPAHIQLVDMASCPVLRHLQVMRGGGGIEERPSALHTLDLTYCCKLDPASLANVCGDGDLKLQHLHLSWLVHLPIWEVAALLRRAPHLETTVLRGIADSELLRALEGHSQLQWLDCAFSAVWSRDVWKLLHQHPHLARCNVRGCKNLTKAEYRSIVRFMANRIMPSPATADIKTLGGSEAMAMGHCVPV
mmetsp:Transcript_40880/g.102766  ORF Transcript_40880/g.102766 Transcript_40880/m.102766 type:complete len:408 (+) Transcript_40880:213-1436(+)